MKVLFYLWGGVGLIYAVGVLLLQAIPYAVGGSHAGFSLTILIWIGGTVFFAAGHMIDEIGRIASSEKVFELDA